MLYLVNTVSGQHPKKEVREALGYAADHGWTVTPKAAGHAWGFAVSPDGSHRISIWSTPKNPGNHAKQIRRAVDRH